MAALSLAGVQLQPEDLPVVANGIEFGRVQAVAWRVPPNPVLATEPEVNASRCEERNAHCWYTAAVEGYGSHHARARTRGLARELEQNDWGCAPSQEGRVPAKKPSGHGPKRYVPAEEDMSLESVLEGQ